ncbi:hypothetical protein [Streptomyces sp. G1]|uniref:hypothetical protein n=1 Tax=Streptomyces sp. G1 TaxID=361572 RepID=UPI00202F602A|nr:hypothetical protein [Streptomyces sp. G1]MCM1967939.1 hypothetical protein [Streptomyces sp. G1]
MSNNSALILLACAVTLLLAALIALAAGYLARRDQASYSTAVVRAATAFAATVTLTAAVATALATITP